MTSTLTPTRREVLRIAGAAVAVSGKFKVRVPKSSKLYSIFADQLGRNPYSMPVPSNTPKRVSLALALAEAANAGPVADIELPAE